MFVCSLFGALGGDLIGSIYEGHSRHVEIFDFPLFRNDCCLTDDSILTLATADKLLHGGKYVECYRKWVQRYPHSGFSHTFKTWGVASTPQPPYGAKSNGSAMRCSPIGFVCNSVDEVLAEAERSASVSHSHPEGIHGAQAAALAVYMARTGSTKAAIKAEMEERFGYVFNESVDDLRLRPLGIDCKNTLPASLQAFFESDSYENAIRKAIFIGGDSDTFAAIAGSIALAFYKAIPSSVVEAIERLLTDEMRQVCLDFARCFPLEIKILPSGQMNLPLCKWRGESWKSTFADVVSRSANENTRDILHNLRGGVFQHTVSVVKAGGYYSEHGENVELPDSATMQRKSVFLSTELPPAQGTASPDPTTVEIINDDCLVVAKQLKDNGFNPAVLNMASNRNPGGGVKNGAGAQEENIFRRTNLYCSLYQFAPYATEYGLKKSSFQYPLNDNYGGVYTPDACVFRGTEQDGYPLLDQCFAMSFITVPAMNRPALDKNGKIVPEHVVIIMNKMRTVFRIGLEHGHDSLVLGAWGCGAYRNPPSQIAHLFHEIMMENEFKNKYRKIAFAIIEDHNSRKTHNPQGNLMPFRQEFEKLSL